MAKHPHRIHSHSRNWVAGAVNLAGAYGARKWKTSNMGKKIGQKLIHKKRGPGSKTKTKKQPQGMIKGDDTHTGMTSVRYRLTNGRKLPKNFLPSAPIHYDEFQYFNDDPAGVQATSGKQVCKLIAEIGTFGQGYSIPPSGAGLVQGQEYPTYQSSLPYIDLVPVSSINNVAGGYVSTSITSQSKIILRACEVSMMFRNASSAPTHLDIIFLIAKKHIPRPANGAVLSKFLNKTPMDIWSDGIDQESAGKAIQTFVDGNVAWVAPASGKESYEMPYSRPQECKYFKQFYKIAKVHSVDLSPGAVENLAVHLNLNLVYDYAKDMAQLQLDFTNPVQTANGDNSFRYQTRAGAFNIVVISRGSPIVRHDGGYPSTSGMEVIGTISKKHVFGLVKENNRNFGHVGAYDYVDTNITAANQKQIDINDVNDILKVAG